MRKRSISRSEAKIVLKARGKLFLKVFAVQVAVKASRNIFNSQSTKKNMTRKYRLYYDEQSDRLMITGKSDSDVMQGSARLLNVILDFNTKNQVVNAELLHASEYLKSLSINADILNNVKEGNLVFRQLRNGCEIIFILNSGKKTIAIPYNVHLPNQKQIMLNSS